MRFPVVDHQAAALQRLLRARRKASGHPQPDDADARVWVVAGGRRGVGKTSLAVNLAMALQQREHRVMLLDADVGPRSAETLCGLHCALTLGDFLAGRGDLVDILEVGPLGVFCIAGGTALHDGPEVVRRELPRFLRAMLAMEQRPTHLIVDLPAGAQDPARAWLGAAGDILLVTTPEPAAIADTYALIKTVRRLNPEGRLDVVVNQAAAGEARLVFERLRAASARFLGIPLGCGGRVPRDPAVSLGLEEQAPFMLLSPLAPASRAVRALADHLDRRPGPGALMFFERLAAGSEGGR